MTTAATTDLAACLALLDNTAENPTDPTEAANQAAAYVSANRPTLQRALALLEAVESGEVTGIPVIDAKVDDEDLLEYLDQLLSVQGELMFARENFDEDRAEAFALALMDFMRLHGMRVRQLISEGLAAAPAAPGVD